MKILKLAPAIFFLSAAFAFTVRAEDPAPSPELIAQGRALFNKKEGLPVKYACILCHQKDKAIKQSDVQEAGDKLPAVINKYLTEKAKGTALAPDSEKMKALIAYIKYEHAL